MAIETIEAVAVREKMTEERPPLLVCAYEDDDSYRLARLEGSMSLSEFRAMQPALSRDREIVFY